MPERLTYRFGPLERRGIFGGARAGQVIVLAGGMAVCVAILDTSPTVGGALTALLVVLSAGALAFLPMGRRSLQEWAPIAAAHLVRRATGSIAFRSRAPGQGRVLRERPGNQWEPRDLAPHPPASLGGIRVAETSYGQRGLGIISDRKGRWLTPVLACQVVAFALLDPEAQRRGGHIHPQDPVDRAHGPCSGR
jgi:hypothetical protein